MRSETIPCAAFGFCAGVMLQSLSRFSIESIIAIWAFAAVAIVSAVICSIKFRVSRSKLTALLIVILFFSIGIFRFYISDTSAPIFFDDIVGEKVKVIGKISQYPDERENKVLLVVKLGSVNTQTSKNKINILVSSEYPNIYNYGDILEIEGKLENVENFITDNGREFDYISYLEKDKIYFRLNSTDINIISHGENNLKKILFSIRRKVEKNIDENINVPESDLLKGELLGAKHLLGPQIEKEFIRTGTMHIVALSGYNVSIVAGAIMKSLLFLPKRISFFGGVISIIMFAIMAGGGGTVMRASIMSIIAISASFIGRMYSIEYSLMIAGVVMIAVNPFILMYDYSFQLSFLATVGLVYISPKIIGYFNLLPLRFGIKEIFVSTIATQLAVLPYLAYLSGNISLVSLPANLALLPVIPITMLSGFTTIVSGFFGEIFAFPIALVAHSFLSYQLAVIKFFSSLPFASLEIENIPFLMVCFIYIVIYFTLSSIRSQFKFSKKASI